MVMEGQRDYQSKTTKARVGIPIYSLLYIYYW